MFFILFFYSFRFSLHFVSWPVSFFFLCLVVFAFFFKPASFFFLVYLSFRLFARQLVIIHRIHTFYLLLTFNPPLILSTSTPPPPPSRPLPPSFVPFPLSYLAPADFWASACFGSWQADGDCFKCGGEGTVDDIKACCRCNTHYHRVNRKSQYTTR